MTQEQLTTLASASMTPTVHLNGTSKNALLDQITDVEQVLGKAIEALSEASPNGRDYYPQGPDALRKAQKEHDARMAALVMVQHSLFELADRIAGAGK
jgi:hypothetical protein